MPRLTATRTYEDNRTPLESDIDSFVDDIEILVNTTKLDNDNFQAAGITGSTKLIDESVATTNIRNNSVSTVKIQDSAVTTAKFEDNSLTTAKFASASVTNAKVPVREGLFPVGAVMKFHTFNGLAAIPRGWMILDGDQVTEANYEAQHGAGTYTTDAVSASLINGKYLPNMTSKYAIGTDDTTKAGDTNVSITSVGRASHALDLRHSHSTTHSHGLDGSSAANEPRYTYGAPSDIYKIFAVDDQNDPMKTDTTTITSSTSTYNTATRPASTEFIFIMRVV